MTWWSATCRQRINANGSNTTWFILLKERKKEVRLGVSAITLQKNLTWSSCCSLSSRQPSSITSDWVGLPRPSPYCLRLFLGINCLSFPHSGGRGQPAPPPPTLTPFSSSMARLRKLRLNDNMFQCACVPTRVSSAVAHSIGCHCEVCHHTCGIFLPNTEWFRITTTATGWDNHASWGGAGCWLAHQQLRIPAVDRLGHLSPPSACPGA